MKKENKRMIVLILAGVFLWLFFNHINDNKVLLFDSGTTISIRDSGEYIEYNGLDIPVVSVEDLAGQTVEVAEFIMAELFYFVVVSEHNDVYAVQVDEDTFNMPDVDVGTRFPIGGE